METPRLDAFLVARGDFPSRARAQAAIKAGHVKLNGASATKPSASVPVGADVAVDGDAHDFVSRGGVKLDAALAQFDIDPSGRHCLDLGASTGGFTDVLLRRGAASVVCIDVGAGQLHPSLVADRRVVSHEKTNAKDLTAALAGAPDLIVCDLSFISLTKALPAALAIAAPTARLIALVKPQFEVGPKHIGKGGIVKDVDGVVRRAVNDVAAWLDRQEGWRVIGVIDSPIKGGDGNREFLMAGEKRGGDV